MPADPPVELARAAAMDAVLVCRAVAAGPGGPSPIAKDDHSPVTVADFAAQAVIVRRLRKHGPAPIVGEERAAMLRLPQHAALRDAVVQAVRPVWPDADAEAVLTAIDGAGDAPTTAGYWTVDPIDGTRGFVRGRQYAVCLAWIAGGQPRVAVMACPNLPRRLGATMEHIDPQGTLFVARVSHGLRWGPAQLGTRLHRAGPVAHELPSPLVVTHSPEGRYNRLDDVARVLEALGVPIEIRPVDGQAKYGMVARGQAHAYLRIPRPPERTELVWDHAPGCLVATAAGVRVTDLRGRALDFSSGATMKHSYGVLCAPPVVHQALLEAIATLGLQHPAGARPRP